MNRRLLFASLVAAILPAAAFAQEGKLKALIVDGQNNHGNWPQTTKMMKKYLEETGKFTVDVATTAPGRATDPNFKPEFKNYAVVVSNYNGAAWPEATQTAFIDYVKG